MEQHIPIFSKKICFLLMFSLAAVACSSFDLIPSDSLIQRLKGRGPVLVSPDNPFLAANLLLQQESAHSRELAGFLETKGQPAALSVSQEFLTPARIKLYYRSGPEQYNLELLQGIWIINGPGIIEEEEAIALLNFSVQPEPDLPIKTEIVPDKKTKAKVKPLPKQAVKINPLPQTEEPESPQDLVPLFDKKAETLAQETIEQEKDQIKETPVTEVPASNRADSSIEDIISLYAASPAETTPRGDVVHFVTSDQETLRLIASWYTKTDLTLSRIARANRLEASAALSPGDQLVIPSELVKNKMRLPEEALAALAAISQ